MPTPKQAYTDSYPTQLRHGANSLRMKQKRKWDAHEEERTRDKEKTFHVIY